MDTFSASRWHDFCLIKVVIIEGGIALNPNDPVVCRCEEVTLSQITDTLNRYSCSSRETKLRTRAGMGICGGRTCRPLIESMVMQVRGADAEASISLKVQQPVRPVSFGDWGRSL